MILLSGRLIEYNSDTHSPQARQHSHMRPHLPCPDDMKSGFGRTDNWYKGLVFDFSPLFWSDSSNIVGALWPGGTALKAGGCADNTPDDQPARSALRCADPANPSVAENAQAYQFQEPERLAATYRT